MREKANDDTATTEIPRNDETQVQLPAVVAKAPKGGIDDDDDIFLVWPEGDDTDHDVEELVFGDGDTFEGIDVSSDDWLGSSATYPTPPQEDTEEVDEEEEEEGASLLPQKKKKKKKEHRHTVTVDDADDEERDYAFRHAAEDDELAHSAKKKARAQKKKAASESVLSSLKYYKKTRSAKETMLRRLIPIVLIAVFAVGFLFYTFRLQNLYFADLSGYSTRDVYIQSGLKEGMFIFNVRAGEIERRLAKQFPYIQNVRVERQLPDTVTLYFEEDCALFYTQLYDEYFVISESMRVLARYDSVDELPKGLREIELPAVSYAVVGYSLDFFDASYLDFLRNTLAVISDAVVYDKIGALDLSNRYDLKFEYDGRLSFTVGNTDNLDTKLLFVKSIVEDLDADARGSVTLVDNKMASFTAESNEKTTK